MTAAISARLLVGVAGHDGGDGAGQGAALVGVVGQAVAHDERAEVGVAEAEGAEDVRVLRDLLGRIAGVVHQDFLGGDEDAHGGLEPLDVERAVLALELHQVQRGEVAGGVVEEDVFASRDWWSGSARCPCRCAISGWRRRIAGPGRRRSRCPRRSCRSSALASFFSSGLPVVTERVHHSLPVQGGLHELVADAHGEVLVLVHHAAVGVAVVRAVVALLDQRPGLPLLLHLGVDELLDVAVPVAQGVHLGGAAGLAAGLHHVGHLVIDLQEATAGRWAGRRR